MRRLTRDFYARDTRVVAKDLLGKIIVSSVASSVVGVERPLRARIVETEAYHGSSDGASHARGGPTPRSAIMFGPPGHAYIYLIYGMWYCLNMVTGESGFPSAVLIRAGEILANEDVRAGAGPGKLCRALGLDRRHNGTDLVESERLFVAEDDFVRGRVRRGPRINVAYAGAWAERPWRFWIADHPSVSRR
jgi:DNA-3-methyladenine glycosylase